MTNKVEELERRLAILEQELADLQRRVGVPPLTSTKPGEWVPLMVREARAQQPAISAAVDEAFRKMGIPLESVSHEELRRLMAESGIRPEDNIFSREIIAMREE